MKPRLAFACFVAAALLVAVPLFVGLTMPAEDLIPIAAFVLLVQTPCVVLAIVVIRVAINLGTPR